MRKAGKRPYKLKKAPRGPILKEKEKDERLELASYLMVQDEDFYKKLIVTDEKIFELSIVEGTSGFWSADVALFDFTLITLLHPVLLHFHLRPARCGLLMRT